MFYFYKRRNSNSGLKLMIAALICYVLIFSYVIDYKMFKKSFHNHHNIDLEAETLYYKTEANDNLPETLSPELLTNVNFDKTCLNSNEEDSCWSLMKKNSTPRNTVWEQLNRKVFFRRTGAFFFVEKSLLKFFYVTNDDSTRNVYKVFLLIETSNERIKQMFRNLTIKIVSKSETGPHVLKAIEKYQLNILKFQSIDYSKAVMKIIIQTEHTNFSTRYPIDVKIVYAENPNKSGFAICQKCIYPLKKHNEFISTLNWWIAINKKIGFNKINLCFHKKNDALKNIFKSKNADILEITDDLLTLPDFFNETLNVDDYQHNYINYDHQTLRRISSGVYNKYDTGHLTKSYEILKINECFFNNLGTYKFISVMDYDEFIMPRAENYEKNYDAILNSFNSCTDINETICLNNFFNSNLKKCSNKVFNLENYFNKLEGEYFKNSNYNFKTTSLDFNASFYLDLNLTTQIFSAINHFYQNNIQNHTFSSKNLTTILQTKTVNNENKFVDNNYTISFQSADDFKYLKNLFKIFYFIREGIHVSSQVSNNFINRLISVSAVNDVYGKSIHPTTSVKDVGIHTALANHAKVPLNMGRTSHFKDFIGRLKHFLLLSNVTVSSISIDLEYFFCIYLDLVNSRL